MRETPCKMTEKLSLASLMTLRMRAAQPTLNRIGLAGIFSAGVALRQDADDRALFGDGFLHQAHALSAADVDRNNGAGEQHRVPQRQNRQDVGDVDGTRDLWGSRFRLGHLGAPRFSGIGLRAVGRRENCAAAVASNLITDAALGQAWCAVFVVALNFFGRFVSSPVS